MIGNLVKEMPEFYGDKHHAHMLGVATADMQYAIANGEYYGRDSDYLKKGCPVCFPSDAQLSFNF